MILRNYVTRRSITIWRYYVTRRSTWHGHPDWHPPSLPPSLTNKVLELVSKSNLVVHSSINKHPTWPSPIEMSTHGTRLFVSLDHHLSRCLLTVHDCSSALTITHIDVYSRLHDCSSALTITYLDVYSRLHDCSSAITVYEPTLTTSPVLLQLLMPFYYHYATVKRTLIIELSRIE